MGPADNANENHELRLLQLLADLAQWEMDHMPILHTMTGRHVYHCLVARQQAHTPERALMLKQATNSAHHTSKAIRNRVQDLEDAGLLEAADPMADARYKGFVASPELEMQMKAHGQKLLSLMNKYFVLLDKQK
jgi:hypothetical protein